MIWSESFSPVMPRLKRIKYERLYLLEKGTAGDYGYWGVTEQKSHIRK